MLNNHSVQISYLDMSDTTLSAWVREDQRSWFISESTLPAQTTFTKLLVDCAESSVIIEEQRVFGFAMQHIATIKGSEYFNGRVPIVAQHLLASTCGLELPEVPVQSPTGSSA
jgi:hypothetical protein